MLNLLRLGNPEDSPLWINLNIVILSVADLTHIESATDADMVYGIDRQAELFKSTTWKGIKMIAENTHILTESSKPPYTYDADEMARQRSQARAENLAHERAINNKIVKLIEENAALIAEKQSWIAEKQALVAEKQALVAEHQTLAAERQAMATEKQTLATESL